MDGIFRLATLLIFVIWKTYWVITEKRADKEKPKTQPKLAFFDKRRLMRNIGLWLIGLTLVLPLLGYPIFPMKQNFFVQLLGLVLVMVGFCISVAARYYLGTNWANAYDYQIKQKQELVTGGIYSYIRHPIYTGLVLATIGAQLAAHSYLFLMFFMGFIVAYWQGKREERLLEKHFGKAYADYKERTKMLLPFIL